MLGGLLFSHAQTEYSIVGKWRTVDADGKGKAIVEIKENRGTYTGTIYRMLDSEKKVRNVKNAQD